MNHHTTKVRDFFETDAYLSHNPIVPIRARLVNEVLGDLRGGRVLDLGCGDGSISRPLLAAGNEVTLVDLSPSMLRRARELEPPAAAGKVQYVQADLLEWAPDRSYNAVLCIGVLAHVSSPGLALERVAEALRAGGRAVVQITDGGRPLGWSLNRYGRLRGREGYRLNELTGRELIALAATYGLKPVTARRYGFLVPSTGRLPYRWQSALEQRFASGPLSAAAADLLVVFRAER
ncbi:MAG: class I SAM-dependent methyltransferase [Actinomycetota bacterium]|nr:class I SAM-dependent methyltransferase [Actinomycetota bacterium]